MVGGASGDPWSQKWFVLWVVLSEGLYDGSMVEIGKGCGNIDREDSIVWVVVEFFGAYGSSNGILMWLEGSGDGRCDVLGDSAGDNPA